VDSPEHRASYHGKSLLTISAKPGGVGAVYHRWTVKGERSGLRMRTAATGSVLLYAADEKLTAFVELEAAVRDKESRSHRPC